MTIEGGRTEAIRARQEIERRVVSRAVTDLLAAGFYITVDYGDDDEQNDCIRSRSHDEIMAACGACDEEYLRLYRPSESDPSKWKRGGYVFLVYGNDGHDVIADYTIPIEEHLKGANELADQICEGLRTL